MKIIYTIAAIMLLIVCLSSCGKEKNVTYRDYHCQCKTRPPLPKVTDTTIVRGQDMNEAQSNCRAKIMRDAKGGALNYCTVID